MAGFAFTVLLDTKRKNENEHCKAKKRHKCKVTFSIPSVFNQCSHHGFDTSQI